MDTLSKETSRKKKAYIDTMHAQVEHWQQEINEWEEETTRFSAEARLDYLEAIARLRRYWQLLRMNLEELENPDNEYWETNWSKCLEIVAEYKSAYLRIVQQALRDEAEGKIPSGWLQSFVDQETIVAAVAAGELEHVEEV